MATRFETAQRKAQLRRDLRAARHGGAWNAGELATSHRALAEKYGLSTFTIRQELKKLADEGLLHSVERVGTFAGTPTPSATEFYLFVVHKTPMLDPQMRQVQDGFEDAIAARGGSVLMLALDEIRARCARAALPPLAGIFDLAYRPGENPWPDCGLDELPRVSIGSRFETRPGYDLVSFNDREGGALATRHLMARGHRNIAFLALHSLAQESSLVDWSAEREAGWQQEMEREGLEWRELSFHPARDAFGNDQQRAASAHIAQFLLRRPEITAVVAANDFAALGLLQALRQAKVPPRTWPSIIGFDNDPLAQDQLLTSLRVPFEAMGAAAAELLWNRYHGKAPSQPQQTRVPMRLVPRLSCHLDWSQQFEPAPAPLPVNTMNPDIYDAPVGAGALDFASSSKAA